MPIIFLLLLLSPFVFASEQKNLVAERAKAEQKSYKSSFVLTPHKINYILPFTYQTKPNDDPYLGSDIDFQHAEVKFQFSFKVPITQHTLFSENGYLYLAYTAQSLWQAYNSNESSPFRDTNHEPEIILSFLNEGEYKGLSMPLINFGFSHQSNGQSGLLSRSWNRLYIDTTFAYQKWYLSVKPWWRVPEQEKDNVNDAKGDDNPDIHNYYGYFELRAFRQLGDNEISIMMRNNLHSTQYGAVEVNYSYPINKQVLGYIQLFHGYGETLLDYNHSNSRVGFGFMFSNWL
jgi:phospholipase A1